MREMCTELCRQPKSRSASSYEQAYQERCSSSSIQLITYIRRLIFGLHFSRICQDSVPSFRETVHAINQKFQRKNIHVMMVTKMVYKCHISLRYLSSYKAGTCLEEE